MARTTKADLKAQGEAAFARALNVLGHTVIEASGGADQDLVVTVDGIEVSVDIKAASVITPETVRKMLMTSAGAAKGIVHVAVGDLITGPARDALRGEAWGWLDRRGHLMLRAEGVHIDTVVPADDRPGAGVPRRPISGRAAVSWAAALLMESADPPSMREVARRVSLSHSAIVVAAKKLKAASLTRSDGRPLIPELFWALAEEWDPRPVALATLPPPEVVGVYAALDVNVDQEGPGWAVSGTLGAATWGAPVAIGSSYPPDFYVPSAAALRQATLRLGEASRFENRACTVALAPTPLVYRQRFDREGNDGGRWPVAHGVFAALDLAQDRARGAEILADWEPKDFTRVW